MLGRIVEHLLLLVAAALIITGGFFFGEALYDLGSRDQQERTDLPDLVPGINAPDKAPPVIRLHDLKTGRFFCSATVISANYAVTAGHCLNGLSRRKPTIEVRALDGSKALKPAIAAFYDMQSDTGMILGDFSAFNPMLYIVQTSSVLQIMAGPSQVFVCGFPHGSEFFCSSFSERRQMEFWIMGQGFLYPGMSGGPVIIDLFGVPVLVGIGVAVNDSGIVVSPLIELITSAKIKIAAAAQ